MLKTQLSNYILSKVDINKVKEFLGNAPILNIFYKLGSQSLIDYKYPTHIFIETTRLCNLKCQSCPRDLSEAKVGNMSFELFKKIIGEATTFGVRNFCLHMFGEPLLHPQIVEMSKYIKASNVNHAILLTTNGYFLTDAKARGLIEVGVDKIAVSFFSLRNEKLESLTGDNNIEVVVDNIRNASTVRRGMNGKTKIFIRFLMCKENEDELKDFRILSKDTGIPLEVRWTHNYSGVIGDNYTNKFTFKKRYPCYHPWFSPAISWDGKVLLCCNDWDYFEILGDINNESMASIWQGERIDQVREFHLAGHYNKIPLCEKCNVWTIYPDIFFNYQKKDGKKQI